MSSIRGPMHRPHAFNFASWLLAVFLCGAIFFAGCKRQTESSAEPEEAGRATGPIRSVTAAWYHVPDDSLAKRRATPNEFTAAHNSLPLGTLVRVSNPANGRTALVRITDRGIHDRRVKLDLCEEAARELGMLAKGFAKLEMEVLPAEPTAAGEGKRAR